MTAAYLDRIPENMEKKFILEQRAIKLAAYQKAKKELQEIEQVYTDYLKGVKNEQAKSN